MIRWTGLAPWEFEVPFVGSLDLRCCSCWVESLHLRLKNLLKICIECNKEEENDWWEGFIHSVVSAEGGYLEKRICTPMAQSQLTRIISMIKWIRTGRLSIKNSPLRRVAVADSDRVTSSII